MPATSSNIQRLYLGSAITPLGAKMLLSTLTTAQNMEMSVSVDRSKKAPPVQLDVVLDLFPPGLHKLTLEIMCEAKYVSIDMAGLATCKELQYLTIMPGWPDLVRNVPSLSAVTACSASACARPNAASCPGTRHPHQACSGCMRTS